VTRDPGSAAPGASDPAPSSRATACLAALVVLALLVPALESLTGATLARGSLAALALLPWLALAALPRRAPCGSAAHVAALAGALASVPVALGAGVDLARAADPRDLARAGLATFAALVLWIAAAASAAGAPRTRTAYGVAWLVLVPGLAALELALAWVPLSGSAPAAAPARAWAVAPLVACRRWGSADGLESFGALDALLAPLAAALVLAGVLALRAAPSRSAEDDA
jgi:hypothetical protein